MPGCVQVQYLQFIYDLEIFIYSDYAELFAPQAAPAPYASLPDLIFTITDTGLSHSSIPTSIYMPS